MKTARCSIYCRLTLGLLLVLDLLLAALPQPARAASPEAPLAATKCQARYIVKEGDTTGKIARKYDISWAEIADANDLEPPYDLEVGQRLCIPYDDDDNDDDEDDDEAANPKAVFTARISGGKVYVSVSKLSRRSVFKVKVRDVDTGVGGWEKLGNIKAKKNQKVSLVFTLPDSFEDVVHVSVCFKNMTTDELVCKVATNIP